jgi:heterodisulfide reductase subunit A
VIDFDQQPSEEVVDVGAIVLATGYDPLPLSHFGEYGHDKHPDVIDGLMFERLLSASGPTAGELRRPSDGAVPKSIAFVQCAGSRDPERGKAYCSQICCMYTAKHALLYHHAVPDSEAFIFYIDIRAGGKGYEEFIERAREEAGITYIRGKVAKLLPKEDGKLEVWSVDTLLGEQVKLEVDLVVLATAIVPSAGIEDLARVAGVAIDGDGFLSEAHPKLRPVESQTRGIFLAGTAQGPRDISESVAHASGAASKVLVLLSREELVEEPTIAEVNDALCRGCEFCVSVCPYGAIDMNDGIARVNETLCRGCGICAPACFAAALGPRGFEDDQVLAQIRSLAC